MRKAIIVLLLMGCNEPKQNEIHIIEAINTKPKTILFDVGDTLLMELHIDSITRILEANGIKVIQANYSPK